MLKKIWQKIWQKIRQHKFFLLSILFLCLTIHYGTGYFSQKKEAEAYKAKWEAVSALFKPSACLPCPMIEAPKCLPQVQPVPSETSRPAPISRRENAPRQAEPSDQNDALSEAAEAGLAAFDQMRKELAELHAQKPRKNQSVSPVKTPWWAE